MKLESIFSNKLVRLIFPFAIFLALWPFIRKGIESNREDRLNSRSCIEDSLAARTTIHGVVVEKYLNTRRLRKLKYITGLDTLDSELFIFETTQSYEFIEPGDTLFKEAGDLTLRVKRPPLDTLISLDYGCNG